MKINKYVSTWSDRKTGELLPVTGWAESWQHHVISVKFLAEFYMLKGIVKINEKPEKSVFRFVKYFIIKIKRRFLR